MAGFGITPIYYIEKGSRIIGKLHDMYSNNFLEKHIEYFIILYNAQCTKNAPFPSTKQYYVTCHWRKLLNICTQRRLGLAIIREVTNWFKINRTHKFILLDSAVALCYTHVAKQSRGLFRPHLTALCQRGK